MCANSAATRQLGSLAVSVYGPAVASPSKTILLRDAQCSVTLHKVIVIVTNAKNSANIRELEPLNIKPYKIIEVAEKYAFETDYERIKDAWKTLQDGDIVICLCGPLGRILCYEWYKANPQLTCLELGSMFDPLLQHRSYLYHTGNRSILRGMLSMPRSERVFTTGFVLRKNTQQRVLLFLLLGR